MSRGAHGFDENYLLEGERELWRNSQWRHQAVNGKELGMSNVVKFTGKKPLVAEATGPYWAGQPLKEAFPGKKVRTVAQVQARRLVMFEGELCYIEDEGPEGAA